MGLRVMFMALRYVQTTAVCFIYSFLVKFFYFTIYYNRSNLKTNVL
jgi:hypothetical protein